MLHRTYHDLLIEHFSHEKNMAFVAGPRQSGKTTTAVSLFPKQTAYWNWDDGDDRPFLRATQSKFLIETDRRSPGRDVLVLDEIHKNKKWRNWLKGLYDKHGKHRRIIVSGSARLNVFNRGGDSLLGRYYLYRHHPLSLGELSGAPFESSVFRKATRPDKNAFATLEKFGGFPAPFLAGRDSSHKKWLRMRRELLLREDVRDLSKVEDIAAIELMATLLRTRAGGLLNLQNIANDLQASVDSVRRWFLLLSNLFYAYAVPPYSRNVKRALTKMPKVYLWDWSEITDEAARFENMIASHLLKAADYWTDSGVGDFELRYIRDKQKREVDFLVTRDNEPFLLAECKLSDKQTSSALLHYAKELRPHHSCQIVKNFPSSGVYIPELRPCQTIAATDFCACLV